MFSALSRRSLRFCAGIALAAVCWAAPDLRLIDAVKRRDTKAAAALIGQHADVNTAQPDGATALAWAAFLDETAVAESLLAAGAKVTTADEYGESPLTLACANGNAALVEKFLAAGANANAARWDGETGLMIAANTGNPAVVRLLIDHGADVNAAESRKGQTALMWAAAEGHSGITRLLIAHGANVKAASKNGFTALEFAAIKNDDQSVRALLAAGADPNHALPDGVKALLVAAAYRSSKAAEALADGGADPNVADRTGNTPLHSAAQFGAIELVNKLIAKHADVNARTNKTSAGGRGGGGAFRIPPGEQTPLLLAARANQPEVMRALVKAGADPTLKAQDGTTLLMAAAGSGHVEAVRYAYELDPRVDSVTTAGSTVMHAAVTGTGAVPQPEICKVVQFLADQGAPLDAKDARGRTPMAIADILPLDTVVELLTQLIVKSGATPAIPSKR
ncbi:MAG TPA: ankyrin repeat domain-containing protein [Candidatus Sulfopaludibacter sp.]|nr:ankyrin repeat domain-containing protein [Candidatus Sulfopaludibacter sp.]